MGSGRSGVDGVERPASVSSGGPLRLSRLMRGRTFGGLASSAENTRGGPGEGDARTRVSRPGVPSHSLTAAGNGSESVRPRRFLPPGPSVGQVPCRQRHVDESIHRTRCQARSN